MNKNNDKRICLNPNCSCPSQRVFLEENDIQHKRCQNWVVSSSSAINQSIVKRSSIPLQQQVSINISYLGIESVFKFLQIQDWIFQMQTVFDQMKTRIIEEIQNTKNQKTNQFKLFIKKAKLAHDEIIYHANMLKSDQPDAKLFKQPLNLWQLQKMKSLTLFENTKIKTHFEKILLPEIYAIGDLIQSFKVSDSQSILKNRTQAINKTNQYLYDNTILINDKLQKLTSLFGKQMVKTVYDNQLSAYKTSCWVCDSVCWTPKQDSSRLGCLQQLLLHLINFHCKDIYLNYVHKVLKFQVQQIGFKNFIHKSRYQNTKQIIIIDRENAGLLEKPLQLQPNRLWIQIVNKDNKKLARGPYITAQSTRKDAADILITALVYELAKNQIQNLVLVTKDHFGITLKELIQNSYSSKLQCIEPKDFISLMNKNSNDEMEQL